MSEEKETGTTMPGISLDLTPQAKIANTNAKLIKKILSLLKSVANEHASSGEHKGALIVLGEFVRSNYIIPGMRQIGTNPLMGKAIYINGSSKDTSIVIPLLSENADGAIIIDSTGQIMATQVYLHVEHAEAQVEEECSTRHISAASFSMNPHIIACFTLSEETSKVRYFADGKQVNVYDPHEKKEDGTDDDDDDVELET